MRFVAAILFAFVLLGVASPARADLNSVAAREVARNNNCTPKKIDVYQQTLGSENKTVYRVECTMAKVVDDKAPKGNDALLISCRDNMCELVRPLALSEK